MTKDEALDKKAENARELGLDYEPVAFASHGVVNWIADKQFQHEADLYTPPQRTWVGLTKAEVELLSYIAEGNTWIAVELAETKLRAKNT